MVDKNKQVNSQDGGADNQEIETIQFINTLYYLNKNHCNFNNKNNE